MAILLFIHLFVLPVDIDTPLAEKNISFADIVGYRAETSGYHAETDGCHADIDGCHAETDGCRADIDGYRAGTSSYHAETDGYRAGTSSYHAETDGYHAETDLYPFGTHFWSYKGQKNQSTIDTWGNTTDSCLRLKNKNVVSIEFCHVTYKIIKVKHEIFQKKIDFEQSQKRLPIENKIFFI